MMAGEGGGRDARGARWPFSAGPEGGWFAPVVRLAVIGFLVNTQPSEPFLTPFVETQRNVTHAQLVSVVYPFWTWSALILVLPCGLLAERLGYRTLIFVGLLARQITRCCLIFGSGLLAMIAAQIAYGLATAVNTAVFFSYVYIVVRHRTFVSRATPPAPALEKQYAYRSGTAWVRSIQLRQRAGQSVGSGLGVAHCVPLSDLFLISWAFSTAGFLFALVFMPAPGPARALLPSTEACLEDRLIEVASEKDCEHKIPDENLIVCFMQRAAFTSGTSGARIQRKFHCAPVERMVVVLCGHDPTCVQLLHKHVLGGPMQATAAREQ